MADIWKDLSDNLNRLNIITQQLTRLDRDVDEDGSDQQRVEMKHLRDEGQDLIKKTKNTLTQPYDRSQKARHDKLQTQLTELSTQFEKVAKVTIKKEMDRRLSSQPPPSTSSRAPPSLHPEQQQQQQPSQQQQQLHQQEQIQASSVDRMIIEERNADIKSLEKELAELSDVFVDVLKLAKEQGEDLNTVQNNVHSAVEHTDKGNSELKQASKYACAYRKKMVILITIIVVVIAVLIIGLAVGLHNKNSS